MPRGPLGGPRPLLNVECSLRIKLYGAQEDQVQEIARTIEDEIGSQLHNLPNYDFDHKGGLMPVFSADLGLDRIPVEDILFVGDRIGGVTKGELNREKMTIVADAQFDSTFPRPLADEGSVFTSVVLETTYPESTDPEFISNQMNEATETYDFINDWTFSQNADVGGPPNSVLATTTGTEVRVTDLSDYWTDLKNFEDDLAMTLSCFVTEVN